MTVEELMDRARDGAQELEHLRTRYAQIETGFGPGSIEAETVARMISQREKRWRAECRAAMRLVDAMEPGRRRDVVFGFYIERKTLSGLAISMHLALGTVKNAKRAGIRQLVAMGMSPERVLPKWYGEKQ